MSNKYGLFGRHEWESDEMYDLRKKFIQKYGNLHKYAANPNRLLCLAQLLINIRFLGCSYDEGLMKKVLEMAENLNSNQPYNDVLVSTSSQAEDCVKQNGTKNGVFNETSALTKKRCIKDDDNVVTIIEDDKRPAAKIIKSINHNQAKSIADQKLDMILLVRAQLYTIANDKTLEQSVELMNAACRCCKVEWRIDFTTIDELTLFKLSIGGVLALKLFHYSADQCKVQRSVCRKAIELLRKIEKFTIQQHGDNQNTYELLYNGKNSSHWQYDILTEDLKSLGVHLRAKSSALYATVRKNNKDGKPMPEDSLNVLRLACEQVFKEKGVFEVRKNRVEGWSEDAIIRMCKVEIERVRLQRKAGDHQMQLESISTLCSQCIDYMSSFDKQNIKFEHKDNACIMIKSTQAEVPKQDAIKKIVEKFPNYKEMFALLRQNMPVADKCPNSVSRLYECASRSKLGLECVDDADPEFRNQTPREVECDAILEDSLVLARGRGKTKKAAKLDVCQKAIDVILQNDLSSVNVL